MANSFEYSHAQRKAAIELYRTTRLSTRQVGEQLGIGRQTVADWIRAAGLSRTRNASRAWPLQTQRRAIALYTIGQMSTAAIADKLDVPHGTVRKWIKRAGITRTRAAAGRLRSRYSDELCHRIWALREQGVTYRTICDTYDIPMGTAHSLYLRGLGMRRRRPGANSRDTQ